MSCFWTFHLVVVLIDSVLSGELLQYKSCATLTFLVVFIVKTRLPSGPSGVLLLLSYHLDMITILIEINIQFHCLHDCGKNLPTFTIIVLHFLVIIHYHQTHSYRMIVILWWYNKFIYLYIYIYIQLYCCIYIYIQLYIYTVCIYIYYTVYIYIYVQLYMCMYTYTYSTIF